MSVSSYASFSNLSRERAASSLRRGSQRPLTLHTHRRNGHRYSAGPRRTDARVGARACSIPRRDGHTERGRPAPHQGVAAHRSLRRRRRGHRVHTAAARASSRRRRALAETKRRHDRRLGEPAVERWIRHHVDDRHQRLHEHARLPASAGRDRRGGDENRTIPGGPDADQRAVDAHARRWHAALPPRGGVLPLSRRAAEFHGISRAPTLGARPQQRLGPEWRAADVRQDRPRREQLLSLPRARERGNDAGGVDAGGPRRLQSLLRASHACSGGLPRRPE